jgi:adenine deaminase
MLTLTEFTKAVIPHGTTTVVMDPHELVNVTGVPGLDLLISEASKSTIRYLIELPSCVPSLPGFETTGGVLDSTKINELLKRKEIFALAEMMNYPGVLLRLNDVISNIDSAKEAGKMIEGHAPLLQGKELQAYIAAGITSDHEATSASEVLEKLRLGMKIQLREGSFAKDLKNIFVDLKKEKIDTRNLVIASDDRNSIDLFEKGHLDYTYKQMLDLGVDPLEAIQMMTINTATHLGLQNEIGGISPGKSADLIVVNNLEKFEISLVISQGKIVFKDGIITTSPPDIDYPDFIFNTLSHLTIPSKEDLYLLSDSEEVNVRVIGLKDQSLLTEKLQHILKTENGILIPDIEEDVIPIVVVNRHTKEKKIGKGFVKGLGIKNAAIASTVAHDSHQLICAGTDYELMIKAISTLKKANGGQVVVTPKKATLLELNFAGIMSSKKYEELVTEQKLLHEAVKELESNLTEPFMGLAFVALPVISHLKLTDHGLVDVDEFKLVNPIIE